MDTILRFGQDPSFYPFIRAATTMSFGEAKTQGPWVEGGPKGPNV